MERDPYDPSIGWAEHAYSANAQNAYPSNSQAEQQEVVREQSNFAYPVYTSLTPAASADATPQVTPAKQAKKKPNMPKQKALALASSLKKGILVSSIVSLGFFGVLSANHIVSTTSSSTVTSPSSSSSSSTTHSSSSSSSTSSSQSSSSTKSSGSSSSTSSNSQQNGGYGFGSGSSSSGSASGTSVS